MLVQYFRCVSQKTKGLMLDLLLLELVVKIRLLLLKLEYCRPLLLFFLAFAFIPRLTLFLRAVLLF